MSFFKELGGFIIAPLYWITSVVLVGWHEVFGALFGATSGVSWVLSIIGLTLVVRTALIPLFVKQIKAQRNMQLIQPKVKELQKKYGHDREKLAAETMALYKDSGTNPLASCLPLLVQMPIFIALFRLIDQATKNRVGHGILTDNQAVQFAEAKFFGGSISLRVVDDGPVAVKVVAIFLVLLMCATTFLTQRQLMSKNMPADAMTGQYAQQQKLMLYALPFVFAFSGIFFPIGVLFYWGTSNLWTMGQQFYVIRNNPAPNTEAFRAKQKRDAEKAARHGHGAGIPIVSDGQVVGSTADSVQDTAPDRRPAQRQQPRKQTRQERRTTAPATGSAAARSADNGRNGAAITPKKAGPQKSGPAKSSPKPGQKAGPQSKQQSTQKAGQGKKRPQSDRQPKRT